MANRIVGNVLIVDSGMGNELVLPGNNIAEFQVSAIAVWGADTTAAITLTEANTATDLVYKFNANTTPGGGGGVNPLSLTHPIKVGDLKVPVLTAATGFIYLA